MDVFSLKLKNSYISLLHQQQPKSGPYDSKNFQVFNLSEQEREKLEPEEQEPVTLEEEPKLLNSSSPEESRPDPEPEPSPETKSIRRRDVAGTLTGGSGGFIGKRNFSKSYDPRTPFLSLISSLRATSASGKPFLLRNSSTTSTSIKGADRFGPVQD